MSAPTTLASLLVAALFLVPGVVFSAIYEKVLGPVPNQDTSSRLLRALTFSVAVQALLFLFLSSWYVHHARTLAGVINTLGQEHKGPLTVAQNDQINAAILDLGNLLLDVAWMFLVVLIIAAVAGFGIARMRRRVAPRMVKRKWLHDSTPQSWDSAFAVVHEKDGFVRVRTKDGEYRGGAWVKGSHATCWPAPPQVWIGRAANFDQAGDPTTLLPGGVWINCTEARSVDVLHLRLRGRPQTRRGTHAAPAPAAGPTT